MRALVMTSLVLRRVRNCPAIIIIIINEKYWLSFSIHKVILTCLGGPFFSGHGVGGAVAVL